MSVLLGLGSNLEDRCGNLEKALGALAELAGTSLVRWSTAYESEALLKPESPLAKVTATRMSLTAMIAVSRPLTMPA